MRAAGLDPICDGDPRADICWVSGRRLVVVEVKSVTDRNEEHQLRFVIGQFSELLAETAVP